MTDETKKYYSALDARVGKAKKKTVPFDTASDSFFAESLETLDSPPFRPPTPTEIQQALPRPKCSCSQAQYAVFVWCNPLRQHAGWYVTMQTPLAEIPEVKHCPFCGDELPALTLRKNLPDGYPSECYYSTSSPK